MNSADWDQRIDAFYADEFDESDPVGAITRMRELVGERPDGDAAALFELAGVHDALGREHEAVDLYRQAIAAGLEGERAARVHIQLASTLRNVGAAAEAVTILESMPAGGVDDDARQAFLALALFDQERYGDALRTALLALVPTLDGYRRSLTDYAAELPSGRREPQPGSPAPSATPSTASTPSAAKRSAMRAATSAMVRSGSVSVRAPIEATSTS